MRGARLFPYLGASAASVANLLPKAEGGVSNACTVRRSSRTTTSGSRCIVGGLANGFLYALIALGYTLVYGVLRLINFAHSEVCHGRRVRRRCFVMRAILGTSTRRGSWRSGTWSSGSSRARLSAATVAFVLERVAYRPLRKRNAPRLTYLISAIGASLLPLQYFAGKEFGRYTAFVPKPPS